MAHSDPLGDMIARIKNGQQAHKSVINCRASRLRASVLEVLTREGYIRGFSKSKSNGGLDELTIELKYDGGQPVIREISRISKPGRRIYRKVSDLPRFYNGLGTYIVSTPQGVLSDQEAREKNVGGEVLCEVF